MTQKDLITDNQLESVFYENFDLPANTRITLGRKQILIECLQETEDGKVGKLESLIFLKNLGDEVNVFVDEPEFPKDLMPSRNDYSNVTNRERLVVMGELMKKPIKLHEIVSEFV